MFRLEFLPFKKAEALAEYYNYLEGKLWEQKSWMKVEYLTVKEILEKYKDQLTEQQVEILKKHDYR